MGWCFLNMTKMGLEFSLIPTGDWLICNASPSNPQASACQLGEQQDGTAGLNTVVPMLWFWRGCLFRSSKNTLKQMAVTYLLVVVVLFPDVNKRYRNDMFEKRKSEEQFSDSWNESWVLHSRKGQDSARPGAFISDENSDACLKTTHFNWP